MQGVKVPIGNHLYVFQLIMTNQKMASFCVDASSGYLDKSVKGVVGGAAKDVQTAQGSSMELDTSCSLVPCQDSSMYWNYMRDIRIVNFYIDSDVQVRFRSRDGKVVFTDLLVGVEKYKTAEEAHNAMRCMFEQEDEIIADIESLEVDEMLLENKVCREMELIIYY